MHLLERFAQSVRHSSVLVNSDCLWDRVRPIYDTLIKIVSKKGVARMMNGTDTIRVAPKFRGVSETYEPEVWRLLMSCLLENDTVVDVGAFIGLYAISIAKRLGAAGRVVTFEPDDENHRALIEHIRLNNVDNKIRVIKAACGAKKERLRFLHQNDSESHISSQSENAAEASSVECVTLDDVFPADRIDILKIDVEGYEELVLKGAFRLLSDEKRKPRLMFIEVHPYAWPGLGTTSDSLLFLLRQAGYQVTDLKGKPVIAVTNYGEIIAVLENPIQSPEGRSPT